MSAPGTISKCVILARGLGTRMQSGEAGTPLDTAQSAAASSGLKAMIPVGRPFLDYVLSALADAGFEQACLVIGPEHDVVREYYTRARPTRIEVSVCGAGRSSGNRQRRAGCGRICRRRRVPRRSTATTTTQSKCFSALQDLGQPGTVLFEADALVRESNIPAERVRDFAYAVIDADGFLADLVEKPDAETAAKLAGPKLVSMNCWRFGPGIFSFCREVPLSPRGEYELPSAVKLGDPARHEVQGRHLPGGRA